MKEKASENRNVVFPDRDAFRKWLEKHGAESSGVWLLFGKKGGPKTLSAHEALEEALCFGWIDGQMQRIDDTSYLKYFARRTARSSWSSKNKSLVSTLIDRGLMAPPGLAAVDDAKKRGEWDKAGRTGIGEEQLRVFLDAVSHDRTAHENLLAMPLSVRKTYAAFYCDAKQEKTRHLRLEKIIDRLHKNLKPM